jgi:release factor glutamine methyltransferase
MSSTFQAVLADASSRLSEICDNPRLDAELLLARVMDRDRSYFYTWPEKALEPHQYQAFESLLQQRLDGVPLAYLLGRREFWSMDLEVTPDVLIPRADTEILVEHALEKIPADEPARVLDLGTGSGAIALAIARERPVARVTAVDRSKAALGVAEGNAQRLGFQNVQFLQSDWYQSLETSRQFDLIVSNPPYIRENDPHLERGDLPYEPRSALASGKDGMDDIRIILDELKQYLRPGGWLLVEHGYDQGELARELFKNAGLQEVTSIHDLQGLERVCAGHLPD